MLKKLLQATALISGIVLCQANANAALVTVGSGFSSLPGGFPAATFGGSGIPNDPMSWALIDANGDGGGDILLALGASQRFSSPVLTNDGTDTFFATPGDTICTGCTDGPRWNFNFYIAAMDNSGVSLFEALNIINGGGLFLDYELDPNTAAKASINLSGFWLLDPSNPGLGFDPTVNLVQNSWNLDFGFLNASAPGITVPAGEAFDRFASGEYSFALTATDGTMSSTVNMNVQVSQVPEPTTIASMLMGLALIGRVRFKKK